MLQQRGGIGFKHWIFLVTVSMVLISCVYSCQKAPTTSVPTHAPHAEQENVMNLPEPRYDSNVSLEMSLLERRSIRSYKKQSLTFQEVSQLLWASQGITNPAGFRTSPSAGALFPLEVYVVVGNVQDLGSGVYRYEPDGHRVIKIMEGDKRTELAGSALGQSCVREASAVFVFIGVYERTTVKYGNRGIRYVHIEVGHAAQNLCLQATALGLGAVTVGAFSDDELRRLFNLSAKEQPLYIIPVGRK